MSSVRLLIKTLLVLKNFLLFCVLRETADVSVLGAAFLPGLWVMLVSPTVAHVGCFSWKLLLSGCLLWQWLSFPGPFLFLRSHSPPGPLQPWMKVVDCKFRLENFHSCCGPQSGILRLVLSSVLSVADTHDWGFPHPYFIIVDSSGIAYWETFICLLCCTIYL